MQLDFSLLSMTELRTKPGELLDSVADAGKAYVIERNGRRKACLVPISFFFPDISPNRIADEINELKKHGEDLRTTITEEREMLFRFPHETVNDRTVELRVVLPHGYPNNCPRVYASPVDEGAPHRWSDGALCLYGVMTGWNPGRHTVHSTLNLARRWLRHYETWRTTHEWPTPERSDT
jgi:prevent-host-death family protein